MVKQCYPNICTVVQILQKKVHQFRLLLKFIRTVSTVREYIKKHPFFYNICTGMQIFDVSNTVWSQFWFLSLLCKYLVLNLKISTSCANIVEECIVSCNICTVVQIFERSAVCLLRMHKHSMIFACYKITQTQHYLKNNLI